MDIFIEHMVKKKKTTKEYVKVALCIIIMIGTLLLMPAMATVPYVGIILFLACAGIIYLLYNIAISINMEYEYAFTNGAFDVDKIIAARRRRRVASLNARSIDIMAKISSDKLDTYLNDRKIKRRYACTDIYDDDVYFVVYSDDKNKYLLFFNPNDGIKDGFKRLNPQKVFLED